MNLTPDTMPHPRQPVIDRLLASRASVLWGAEDAPEQARLLAGLADEAVRELARDAAPPGPWAVIALGGYGAGRLLPASDLDLLILSDAPRKRIEPFATAVFYPLWDAGLAVGHQVRSRKEHLRACRGDLATLTASLTARVVAGDAAFGEKLLADVASRARRDRSRLVRELAARPRAGSPYLLQPDLKEGAGGQRDLDELTWTAAVLTGRPASDPSPLVELALLSAEELAILVDAAGVLATARSRLHLGGTRGREILTLESAEDLPMPGGALHHALATVAFTLVRVRRRAAGASAPPPPATPDALFAALATGDATLPMLEEAAWSGALEPLVPGLAALMDVRRPALSHALTVGAHCLAAAAAVAEAPARDAFAARLLEQLPDRRPLLAAALAHDFGKREPGPGHERRGLDDARNVAAALGIPEAADDVALLVEHHLLLAEAAHTDVADEDTLLRLAARLGKREIVAPLYLLTLADTLATSADAWTPWRAALHRDIALRLDAALADDVEGAGIARSAEETRAAALTLLPPADARRRAFVERAPLRYLAATAPATVARHAALVASLAGAGDRGAAEVAVGNGPAEGTWRVTVATLDRPGLFATLAGVFALTGLTILAAEAMAGPAGTAIDVFTVQAATLAVVDTSTWSGFERTLRAALSGHLDIEVRLAERRRHYPASAGAIETSVVPGAATSGGTLLRIETADRIGLLHDLALALSADGLDIRSATIVTHAGVASDTFRVTDASGEPPQASAVLASAVARLRDAADQ